jgi:DNA repair protein RecN (Recombination protein N)
MLRLLRIRNLALIRELEIEFDRGLNLLTGETGSGKSILVDALGLLLGARSSQEMIRSDCDTAVLEGIFEIESCKSVSAKLAECGFESEDDTLLIRREISASGRNRVFINNHLATVALLKELGDKLADIHGQQDQRSLLDLSTHLEWLDDFGDHAALLKEVRDRYRKLRETERQLASVEINEQERLRRMDVLQFQIEEIRQVNPQLGEKEALEIEKNLLANREKILSSATEVHAVLYERESSVLREIGRLERLIEELARFDKLWSPHREILQEIRYKLEDVAYAARDYAARSDFSPERLEQVYQRLYALEKLTKKYGASSSDILEYLDRCSKELEELQSCEQSAARLSEQLQQDSQNYRALAEQLSEKRRRDAKRLEIEIRKEFAALAMERMEMCVHFHPHNDDKTPGHIPSFYGLDGIDHVEFLIAPNKGEEIRPLAKIASGGELSRLMLSIRSLCGSEELDRTLVFDEVDAGIGGRVAEAVGRRLRDIADGNQVLCVTHLPQISAFARHHFSVHKDATGGRTETIVKHLNDSERIQELSRMLGGETITPTARQHAIEMLEHSKESRQKREVRHH